MVFFCFFFFFRHRGEGHFLILLFLCVLDFMRAVGASSRIFELLDRLPTVRNAGGTRLEKIEGENIFLKLCTRRRKSEKGEKWENVDHLQIHMSTD